MKYGYARVSTDGKSESVDAQVRQLTKAGCKKVFRDVPSGAKTDRASCAASRPARRRRRADGDPARPSGAIHPRPVEHPRRDHRQESRFPSLGDTWADTTTSHGRLMLTVLGGLAEFERDLIRARTGEGRERAKARGVKMGRPFKLTDHQKARGDQAPKQRRDACRHRPQLQRQPGDDFETGAMTFPIGKPLGYTA